MPSLWLRLSITSARRDRQEAKFGEPLVVFEIIKFKIMLGIFITGGSRYLDRFISCKSRRWSSFNTPSSWLIMKSCLRTSFNEVILINSGRISLKSISLTVQNDRAFWRCCLFCEFPPERMFSTQSSRRFWRPRRHPRCVENVWIFLLFDSHFETFQVVLNMLSI